MKMFPFDFWKLHWTEQALAIIVTIFFLIPLLVVFAPFYGPILLIAKQLKTKD